MSIRAARADDHWRHALNRNYHNRYDKLDFRGLFCLADGQFECRGGITAIVGGNGVGKSTLAAALGELLEKELEARYLSNRDRLLGSTLDGVFSDAGTRKSRHAEGSRDAGRKVSGDEITVESWWIDPGYWAFHTRTQVLKDQNFGDVIGSVAPKELARDELERLNYAVGKDYERCLIYEISDYADFDRFPYFRVRASGVEYGTESMGQGELSLLLMSWVL